MEPCRREQSPGKPNTRRYSEEEKARGGADGPDVAGRVGHRARHGQAGGRPARLRVESVRLWVRQADIDDGYEPGVTTGEAARIREFEQENRKLRRANEIPKRAASFFGAELDRQHRRYWRSSTPTATTWSREVGSGSSPSARSCRWPRAPTTRPRPDRVGAENHGTAADQGVQDQESDLAVHRLQAALHDLRLWPSDSRT
jgi:transposase